MKKIFLKILQIIAICYLLMDISVFAQTGQEGTDYPAITNKHIAVIVIDFPDTPQPIKDNYFPTIAALRDTIFNGSIKKYLIDMSYGQFTLTGDVFGYFTHQNPGFVNGSVKEMEDVMKINTINIPGLDINKYDGFLFVPIYDAGLALAWGGIPPFLLNGNLVNRPGFFVPINIGYWNRDLINYPNIVNTLSELQWYGIPIGTDNGIEGTSSINFSNFNRDFAHEFFHFLGVFHANSRTNGTSYDYEPEVPNNNCKCYSDSNLGSLLSMEYGNKYDVMGKSEYGNSLNMAFRDYFGWTNSNNRYSIKNYGHFTTTMTPLNSLTGIRAVEIRIPYKYGNGNFKNQGYFLEVRTGNNKWDKMLLHSQLQGNNDGIMVIKTDGYSSDLLDISPSPNISYYGQIAADIRDVVIKPGMIYLNSEIKLSNVIKNTDGSFTIDIDVFIPATITAGGPTTFCQGNSVILTSSTANSYLWSNGATTQSINVSTSGDYSVTVDNGSGNSTTSNTLTIIVNPLPANAGIINGTTTVCQNQNSVTYFIPEIAHATSYIWTLPTGATGTSSTNSITVNYGSTALNGNISVKGNNSCGDGPISTLAITVNAIPPTPTISLTGNVLHSDASNGNQWFDQNGFINGATKQDYTVSVNGVYNVIVTLLGCSSDASNILNVFLTGIEVTENNKTIKVYPNPVSNELIIEIEGNNGNLNFEILNAIGQIVFKGNLVDKTIVQTSNFALGVYLIILENGKTFEFKKIIKE